MERARLRVTIAYDLGLSVNKPAGTPCVLTGFEIYLMLQDFDYEFYRILALLCVDIFLWILLVYVLTDSFWYDNYRSWNWRAPVEADSEVV